MVVSFDNYLRSKYPGGYGPAPAPPALTPEEELALQQEAYYSGGQGVAPAPAPAPPPQYSSPSPQITYDEQVAMGGTPYTPPPPSEYYDRGMGGAPAAQPYQTQGTPQYDAQLLYSAEGLLEPMAAPAPAPVDRITEDQYLAQQYPGGYGPAQPSMLTGSIRSELNREDRAAGIAANEIADSAPPLGEGRRETRYAGGQFQYAPPAMQPSTDMLAQQYGGADAAYYQLVQVPQDLAREQARRDQSQIARPEEPRGETRSAQRQAQDYVSSQRRAADAQAFASQQTQQAPAFGIGNMDDEEARRQQQTRDIAARPETRSAQRQAQDYLAQQQRRAEVNAEREAIAGDASSFGFGTYDPEALREQQQQIDLIKYQQSGGMGAGVRMLPSGMAEVPVDLPGVTISPENFGLFKIAVDEANRFFYGKDKVYTLDGNLVQQGLAKLGAGQARVLGEQFSVWLNTDEGQAALRNRFTAGTADPNGLVNDWVDSMGFWNSMWELTKADPTIALEVIGGAIGIGGRAMTQAGVRAAARGVPGAVRLQQVGKIAQQAGRGTEIIADPIFNAVLPQAARAVSPVFGPTEATRAARQERAAREAAEGLLNAVPSLPPPASVLGAGGGTTPPGGPGGLPGQTPNAPGGGGQAQGQPGGPVGPQPGSPAGPASPAQPPSAQASAPASPQPGGGPAPWQRRSLGSQPQQPGASAPPPVAGQPQPQAAQPAPQPAPQAQPAPQPAPQAQPAPQPAPQAQPAPASATDPYGPSPAAGEGSPSTVNANKLQYSPPVQGPVGTTFARPEDVPFFKVQDRDRWFLPNFLYRIDKGRDGRFYVLGNINRNDYPHIPELNADGVRNFANVNGMLTFGFEPTLDDAVHLARHLYLDRQADPLGRAWTVDSVWRQQGIARDFGNQRRARAAGGAAPSPQPQPTTAPAAPQPGGSAAAQPADTPAESPMRRRLTPEEAQGLGLRPLPTAEVNVNGKTYYIQLESTGKYRPFEIVPSQFGNIPEHVYVLDGQDGDSAGDVIRALRNLEPPAAGAAATEPGPSAPLDPSAPIEPATTPGELTPLEFFERYGAQQVTFPLSNYTPIVYRETNFEQLLNFIPVSSSTGVFANDVYLANSPTLALGQGENRGVMMEFDASGVKGYLNRRKPMWEMAYGNGEAEFISRYTEPQEFRAALRSFTIKSDAFARPADLAKWRTKERKLLELGWTKTNNPDNSVTWTRPDIATPVAPSSAGTAAPALGSEPEPTTARQIDPTTQIIIDENLRTVAQVRERLGGGDELARARLQKADAIRRVPRNQSDDVLGSYTFSQITHSGPNKGSWKTRFLNLPDWQFIVKKEGRGWVAIGQPRTEDMPQDIVGRGQTRDEAAKDAGNQAYAMMHPTAETPEFDPIPGTAPAPQAPAIRDTLGLTPAQREFFAEPAANVERALQRFDEEAAKSPAIESMILIERRQELRSSVSDFLSAVTNEYLPDDQLNEIIAATRPITDYVNARFDAVNQENADWIRQGAPPIHEWRANRPVAPDPAPAPQATGGAAAEFDPIPGTAPDSPAGRTLQQQAVMSNEEFNSEEAVRQRQAMYRGGAMRRDPIPEGRTPTGAEQAAMDRYQWLVNERTKRGLETTTSQQRRARAAEVPPADVAPAPEAVAAPEELAGLDNIIDAVLNATSREKAQAVEEFTRRFGRRPTDEELVARADVIRPSLEANRSSNPLASYRIRKARREREAPVQSRGRIEPYPGDSRYVQLATEDGTLLFHGPEDQVRRFAADNNVTLDAPAPPSGGSPLGIVGADPKAQANAWNRAMVKLRADLGSGAKFPEIDAADAFRPATPDYWDAKVPGVILTAGEKKELDRIVRTGPAGTGEKVGDVALRYQQELMSAKGLANRPSLTNREQKQLNQYLKKFNLDATATANGFADGLSMLRDPNFDMRLLNRTAAERVGIDMGIDRGLRTAKGDFRKTDLFGRFRDPLTIKAFGKSITPLNAIDSYLNFRRATALYAPYRGPAYILTQYLGNAITSAIGRPTSLNDYVRPANWKTIYRRMDNFTVQSAADKMRQDAGLPHTSQLYGAHARDSIQGELPSLANTLSLGTASRFRKVANVADVAIREAVWTDVWMREIGVNSQRFMDHVDDLYRRADARVRSSGGTPFPINPARVREVVDDLRGPGGNRTFGAKEVQTALEGLYDEAAAAGGVLPPRSAWSNFADRAARDWKESLSALDKKAIGEVNRIAFSFEETVADSVLRRFFMFHYWTSRASALYVEQGIRNPALAAAYFRLFDGMKEENEQREGPKWMTGFLDFLSTPAGYTAFWDPTSLLQTAATFHEMPDMDKDGLTPLGQAADAAGQFAFFNPLIAELLTAAGAMGPSYRTPDLVGFDVGYSNMLEKAINAWRQSRGMGGEVAFIPDSRDALNLLNRFTTGYLERAGAPVQEVDYRGTDSFKRSQFKSFLVDVISAENPRNGADFREFLSIVSPGTDPASDFALPYYRDFLIGLMADYEPNSPQYQEAYARYNQMQNASILNGRLGPVGNVIGALGRQWSPFAIMGQVDSQSEIMADNAAMKEWRDGGKQGPQPVPEGRNKYNLGIGDATRQREEGLDRRGGMDFYGRPTEAIGTSRQRKIADGYLDIKYGNVPPENAVVINGKTYTGLQLVGMTPEDRKQLAIDWMDTTYGPEGWREAESYWDLKDEWYAANPDAAAMAEFSQRANEYPGGKERFVEAVRESNPRFDAYMQEQYERYPDEPEKALEEAFNVNGYEMLIDDPGSTYEAPGSGPSLPYIPDADGTVSQMDLAAAYGERQKTEDAERAAGGSLEQSVQGDFNTLGALKQRLDAYDPSGGAWQAYLANATLPDGQKKAKLPSGIYDIVKGSFTGKDGRSYDYPMPGGYAAGYLAYANAQTGPVMSWQVWLKQETKRRDALGLGSPDGSGPNGEPPVIADPAALVGKQSDPDLFPRSVPAQPVTMGAGGGQPAQTGGVSFGGPANAADPAPQPTPAPAPAAPASVPQGGVSFGGGAPAAPAQPGGDMVKANVNNLNLRAAPHPDATVLRLLPQGEQMTVIGRDGYWVRVRFADGTEGWVSSAYLDAA